MSELDLFQTITWAGVSGLFVYFVLKPLLYLLTKKLNNGQSPDLEKKIEILEKNHLSEIRQDIRELRADIEELRERVAKIEVKINSI